MGVNRISMGGTMRNGADPKVERARLDPNGICRPKTLLVAHVRLPKDGRLIIFDEDVESYELRDETFLHVYRQP